MAEREWANFQESNPMSVNMSEIVKQLSDLVHLVLECEKKELSPHISFGEVNRQLLQLRAAIDLLHQSYLQTLHSLSLSENEVLQYRKNIENLKGPESKLLSTLSQLQVACQEARDRMDASLSRAEEKVIQLDQKRRAPKKPQAKAKGSKKQIREETDS